MRDLKAQMTERSVARKNVMKQMVYARMATRAVGQVKKEESDGVVATSKYCAKAIEDDEEDDEEADEEEDKGEENGLGTDAQGDGDNLLDVFEALFKPLSSSPTLRFVTSCRSHSRFAVCSGLSSSWILPEYEQ